MMKSKYGILQAMILMAGISSGLSAHAGGRQDYYEEQVRQRQEQSARRPDSQRQGAESKGNENNGDPHKAGNRMSLDDRRALRRQINEAGRDLYSPRR